MKTLLVRLKSNTGETLAETLVGILVAVLSLALLASGVVAAADINAKARAQTDTIGKQVAAAETEPGSTNPAGLVSVATSTYGANDGVTFAGGSYVSAYTFNSTPLRQAIASATAVLEDNKDAWKDKTPMQAAQAYVAAVGGDTKVYKLSEEEVNQLLDGSSFPAYGKDGYQYYLFPSCTYVNGEQLNFQFINGCNKGKALAGDHFRPIAILYNGQVYGCFNKAGTDIGCGMYMAGWGPFFEKVLEPIHDGTRQPEWLFTNATRPEAVGEKNQNGCNSVILIPGAVY